VEEDEFVTLEGYPRFSGWMLAIMFVGFSALLAYWAGSQLQSQPWGWRWGICVLLGGLAGYNYATLGLPGSAQVILANGMLGVILISGVGELIGLGIAWLWFRQA
jgi:hypothetical protein